jgi:hypothetical protein
MDRLMSDDGLTRLPKSHCLGCGKTLDTATEAGPANRLPDSGDATIWLHCGHVMAFAADLSLRALTDAEVIELAGDKNYLAAQRARGEFWKWRDQHKGEAE